MVSALEICQFLDEFAPLQYAESWDNVGLLLGRSSRQVSRLMTCLTLTLAVAEEAVCRDVQMIVTHHPILFRGTKKITDQSSEGRLLLCLAENGIVVHSPHTAFDSAIAGINQSLAESLGLSEIQPLKPFSDGTGAGTGRCGILKSTVERDTFLNNVASATRASYLEFSWNSNAAVAKVAVACGAAGEFMNEAVKAGCDTFVTGETRFHNVLDAQAHGINLILTGHFSSERPAVERLAIVLGKNFPTIECFSSEKDQDPLSLFQKRL